MKIVQILIKKKTSVNSEVLVDLKNMESPHYISKNSMYSLINKIVNVHVVNIRKDGFSSNPKNSKKVSKSVSFSCVNGFHF